jgi:uncharacterized protein involved in response to NO
MQVLDRKRALAIAPVLRLGFRPFFLLGSLLAALAVPLWLWALQSGAGGWQPSGGWLAWHRHELVFGFGLAIIAGFLLTAVQTWSGRPGLSGTPLALLALLWLGTRLAWLGGAPALLLVVLDPAFALAVAWVMGRTLYAVRQTRNYPIVGLLLLLAAVDLLGMLGLWREHAQWARQSVLAGVWLIAAMIGLIGGRVIPFFTQRGLGRTEAVKPWPWLDWAALGLAAVIALLHATGTALQPAGWIGMLFAVLGVAHGVRLLRWQDRGLWRVPLLWSLHLAYAWLALACLGMALWHLGLLANASLALHALTVGSIGGMILAMLARVSLGHTGRPLVLPASLPWAFALLNAATLARVALVPVWPQAGLWLAGAGWSLGFALYLWHYAPMLLRTRADGHPG